MTQHRGIDEHTVQAAPSDREFDLATVAARFVARLREAGVVATPAQSMRLVRALELTATTDAARARPSELYWSARVTLLTTRADLAAFDRVFAEVFGENPIDPLAAVQRGVAPTPTPRPAQHRPNPLASARTVDDEITGSATSVAIGSDDAQPGGSPKLVAMPSIASSIDRLATIDFAELDAAELAELATLMRRLRLTPPMRRGRRHRQHPHGDRLDVRATLRRSPRTGGDPVVRLYRRAKHRPRRIIVLCDISGSMQAYARAYVQFLHVATAGARAEVFTFATRLTRLTKELADAQPQLALAKAAATAPDWKGGTRIGDALKTFIDRYGRRGLARGAVVVVLSDGWERDDPAQLGEQMARLRRLAHRVIWVNPRSADPSFAPLAAGMAAALPHCDEFLSGHNLATLSEVAEAIGRR